MVTEVKTLPFPVRLVSCIRLDGAQRTKNLCYLQQVGCVIGWSCSFLWQMHVYVQLKIAVCGEISSLGHCLELRENVWQEGGGGVLDIVDSLQVVGVASIWKNWAQIIKLVKQIESDLAFTELKSNQIIMCVLEYKFKIKKMTSQISNICKVICKSSSNQCYS